MYCLFIGDLDMQNKFYAKQNWEEKSAHILT